MTYIPPEVKQYLSSDDDLLRARLVQQYPRLQETVDDPKTRVAILEWLASDEAHEKSSAGFASACLKFLRAKASQNEAPIVKTFLLHTDSHVRLRAYEFLLTLFFREKDREAMLGLLHSMLSDSDDMVRAQSARYIERTGAADELQDHLQRWHLDALSRGWRGTQSFELVEHLLKH